MQKTEYVDYLHDVFEHVESAGRLYGHEREEIVKNLDRARPRFSKRQRHFFDEVISHAKALEEACAMLDMPDADSKGSNPAKASFSHARHNELTWFSENAGRVNELAERPWTSRKAWAMGIIGSLVVVAIVAATGWAIRTIHPESPTDPTNVVEVADDHESTKPLPTESASPEQIFSDQEEALPQEAPEAHEPSTPEETPGFRRPTGPINGSAESLVDNRNTESEHTRQSYIRRYVSVPDEPTSLAIFIVEGRTANHSFARSIARSVPYATSPNFLFDTALTDNVFDQLYASDAKMFSQLDLHLVAHNLLLGKLVVNFDTNQKISGTVRANARADIRILDAKTGNLFDGFSVESSVLGHSRALASQKAYNGLRTKLIDEIREL